MWNCTVWVLQALILLQRTQGMVLHKSILSGLEQTRAHGAPELPLGDTGQLLTNRELPWNSMWSKAPPALSSAGLIWLKAKAAAASQSRCFPPCELPLLVCCPQIWAPEAAGLQHSSHRVGEKKTNPKAGFVHPSWQLCCASWLFYKPEPRTGVRARDCSRKQCGPQLLGSGCDEPAQEAERICLPDCWVLLLQLCISRVLGGCCSPLVATLLLLGKHSLKFCTGGQRLLESKTVIK